MSYQLGVDIQSVRDVEESIQLFGSKYLQNVYNAHEYSYALCHPYSAAKFLAGRFAAREAILKLLNSHDTLSMWKDVILDDMHSPTRVNLRGDAQTLALSQGIDKILLCIASTRDLATAVAVADVTSHQISPN